MIIPPSTKDFTLDFTLKIDNTIIPSHETVKYLGVIIDSKLSFAPHIKYLESKLSNGIISRLKSTLPNDALLKLYYALFQSHLLYGLTICGSTFPTYLNPIKTLQNRAVKNIGSGSMYDNSNPYYVGFNILKLQNLYIVETAEIVYNYIHRPSMLPSSFLNYFNRAHLISQRSSRSSATHRDLLNIPLLRTQKNAKKYQIPGCKDL